MEKLTANVTHSKWDKPKISRWDVTRMPIMTALEVILLSNKSSRYQIKINNCIPSLRKTEMQSDIVYASMEESRVSTVIDGSRIIQNH